MKRLIIFDFFGVLCSEISPKWFRNHFNEEEAKVLKDKYFIPGDMGDYTFEETIKNMANDLGFTYDEIMSEFRSYVRINTELFDYILKLKKYNNVALLSNAADGIFEALCPVDFNKYFDKYFISAKYRIQKPNLEFYKLCVSSFNTQFDEIYFIDDNIKNIEPIKEIGIIGIHYKNNNELFKILDKFKED